MAEYIPEDEIAAGWWQGADYWLDVANSCADFMFDSRDANNIIGQAAGLYGRDYAMRMHDICMENGNAAFDAGNAAFDATADAMDFPVPSE